MILGITGLAAAGKDTVAEHLKAKGFVFFSLSDVIREACSAQGLEPTRENLINMGGTLRKKYGNDYLARAAMETIAARGAENAAVVSIRHSDEVIALKKNPDFYLIAVVAPLEVRYQRTQTRNQGRPEDEETFEEFVAHEQQERTSAGVDQQLDKVISMADYTINNDGTIEDLHFKIDAIISKIKKE